MGSAFNSEFRMISRNKAEQETQITPAAKAAGLLLSREDLSAKEGGIFAACLPEELVDEHGKDCLPGQGRSLTQGGFQFSGTKEMAASGREGEHGPQALL